MKICYLANSKGSHEKKWAEFFVKKGHQVCFISIDSKGNLSSEKTLKGMITYEVPFVFFINPVLRTISRLLFSKLISKRVQKIIKKFNPDIIHAHSVQYGYISSNLQNDIPKVFTPMGSDVIVYAQKYLLYRYIAKKAFRAAKIVTGDSFLIQQSGFKIGAKKEKNYIIQNGVDRNMFNSRVEKGFIRKKYNLHKNDKILLSTRLIIKNSNILNIVKSFNELYKKDNKIYLFLIYSYKDEKYYKMIKDYILKNSLQNNIFDIGRADYKEIPNYIVDSNVYISIPTSDSSPKSVYEAMSVGVPCVVSDIEWTKNFIEHNKHAFLVKLDNVEKIVKSIKEVIYNKKMKNMVVFEAKKLVAEKIDYNKNMQRMEELMLEVVG